MELADLYVKYRQEEVKFIGDKIIPQIKGEEIEEAARLLNIGLEGKKLMPDNPMEFDYIMDFIIYELRVDGKNLVERFADIYRPESDMEAAVLNAMLNQYSSLYRVVNISREKRMLFYKDIFNNVRNTRLIDLTFSNTAEPGLLVYTRILPLPELNMTSGTSFVFPEDSENKLLSAYTSVEINKKTSMERFMFFNAASKVLGIAIGYEGADTECEHEHHHHHGHDQGHVHDHDCDCGHHHGHDHDNDHH
jgi:hypothetical protein